MDTPDIASIVNMIMENPSLVEQIASMARENANNEVPSTSVEEEKTATSSAPIEEPPVVESRRVHRIKLANAMKPYLSEGRRRAIDAMMSIADILEITREKT